MRYWRWSKQDFFPGDSFQNWRAYQSAMSQIFTRLKDRVASSSEDADEIEELRKQSEIELKRCLSWWDLTWLALAPLLEPASWYSLAKKLMNMPDQLQFYPMWFLAFKQYSLFSATQHLQ
ncbi:hypothetical protein EJD97_011051 [Solanum chilense]|uniref:Uncharacterized protein n=1 Tax=Solanum chilense TaxID=4083 RepID=A0A6N2C922_SOLCI|nr:hypothetical protein EJD97_011051 [Solanum chilense]